MHLFCRTSLSGDIYNRVHSSPGKAGKAGKRPLFQENLEKHLEKNDSGKYYEFLTT